MDIHYISFFCDANEAPSREILVSGQVKMRYMIDCMRDKCRKLHVVSTAIPKLGIPAEKYRVIAANEGEDHVYLPTLSTESWISAKLRGFFGRFQLLRYLLTKVKPGDVVVIYHSLFYSEAVEIFHLLRRNKIVLEFNESYTIYYDDRRKRNRAQRKEKIIIKATDSFILVSPYLRDLIPSNAKSIVDYGDYSVNDRSVRPLKTPLTIAYTGVIEKDAGTAFLFAKAAAFLPAGLKLTVAGFGKENCVSEFRDLCEDINRRRDEPVVDYIGLLQGEQLIRFLNEIDIAFSCSFHSENEEWKARYSFHGKIPRNMACGAYIVAYDNYVVADSPFRPACVLFKEMTPESVAEAITQCAQMLPTADRALPKKIVCGLDESFRAELSDIIN